MVPRLAPCSFGDLAQSWQSYQLCGSADVEQARRNHRITQVTNPSSDLSWRKKRKEIESFQTQVLTGGTGVRARILANVWILPFRSWLLYWAVVNDLCKRAVFLIAR